MPGSPAEPEAGTTTHLTGDSPQGPVTLTRADYLWFVDRALTAMADILRALGDDLANRRPALDGANSAFVILTHCLGVLEYWGGGTVADRPFEREREAEFTASGDVATLVRRTDDARQRLRRDLASFDPGAAPSHVVRGSDRVPYTEAKGAVLLHILEELYQHLGQMELTRDVLLARPAD
jgi:DinB superfamily